MAPAESTYSPPLFLPSSGHNMDGSYGADGIEECVCEWIQKHIKGGFVLIYLLHHLFLCHVLLWCVKKPSTEGVLQQS